MGAAGGTHVPPVIPEPAPEQDDISPFGFSLADFADFPPVVDAEPGSRPDPTGQAGDAAQKPAGNAAQVGQYPFNPETEAYLAAMRARCKRLGQDGLGPGACWRCDLYPWPEGCGPRVKARREESRNSQVRAGLIISAEILGAGLQGYPRPVPREKGGVR